MTVSFLIRLASRIYAFTSDERGAGSKELATASPSERRTGSENAGRFSYQSIGYLLSLTSREHGAGSGITREQRTENRYQRSENRSERSEPATETGRVRSQRLLALDLRDLFGDSLTFPVAFDPGVGVTVGAIEGFDVFPGAYL